MKVLAPTHLDPFEQEIGTGSVQALDLAPSARDEAVGEAFRYGRDVAR